jgi:hypothetical protein
MMKRLGVGTWKQMAPVTFTVAGGGQTFRLTYKTYVVGNLVDVGNKGRVTYGNLGTFSDYSEVWAL